MKSKFSKKPKLKYSGPSETKVLLSKYKPDTFYAIQQIQCNSDYQVLEVTKIKVQPTPIVGKSV